MRLFLVFEKVSTDRPHDEVGHRVAQGDGVAVCHHQGTGVQGHVVDKRPVYVHVVLDGDAHSSVGKPVEVQHQVLAAQDAHFASLEAPPLCRDISCLFLILQVL